MPTERKKRRRSCARWEKRRSVRGEGSGSGGVGSLRGGPLRPATNRKAHGWVHHSLPCPEREVGTSSKDCHWIIRFGRLVVVVYWCNCHCNVCHFYIRLPFPFSEGPKMRASHQPKHGLRTLFPFLHEAGCPSTGAAYLSPAGRTLSFFFFLCFAALSVEEGIRSGAGACATKPRGRVPQAMGRT